MKPHIKRFCKLIERNILQLGSDTLLTEYRSHLISLVTCHLSVDTMIDGVDQVRLLEAVRNSLQYMAEIHSTHAIAPQIWNPFVACTLQTLIDEIRTQPSNPDLKISGITKTKPKIGKKQNSPTRGSTQPLSSVSNTEECLPKMPPSVVSPDEIRRQVRTTLHQRKKHPFSLSPSVRCKDILCRFCMKAAEHVPLTLCASRKSHGKGKCHATGYWPHVGATLWAKWKHPHNAGVDFSLSTPLSLFDGALPPVSHEVEVDQQISLIYDRSSCDEATQSDISVDLFEPGAWARHCSSPLISTPLKRPRRKSSNSSDEAVCGTK